MLHGFKSPMGWLVLLQVLWSSLALELLPIDFPFSPTPHCQPTPCSYSFSFSYPRHPYPHSTTPSSPCQTLSIWLVLSCSGKLLGSGLC